MVDLYLADLARKRNDPVFLNEMLEERGIYFTGDSVQQCLDLLLEKRLILIGPLGFSIFKISRAENLREFRRAQQWTVPICVITDSGLHFVMGGQELDAPGRESRAAERKKWVERGITAFIAIVVSVIGMIVKAYFFDKK